MKVVSAKRMRRCSLSLALCGLLLGFVVLQMSRAQELPPYSLGYDPARDPISDGRDALRLAKASHRMVLIEVGGDWCRWCDALDRFFNQHPDIRARLHERFVVLKVNVDDSNDNAEFLSAFPPLNGYPHLYVTSNDGSIVHSQDPAKFLQNGEYSEQRISDFLDRWSRENE